MRHQRYYLRVAAFLGALALSNGGGAMAADTSATGFRLVPEMETPEGIVGQPRLERQQLAERPEARRGLERLEAWVAAEWPRIREIDLAELSRFHVEETRGYELPASPGELTGRVLGEDEGRWFLEIRGPRLPARYDIVHRYLYVFASFDPMTGELGRLTVTIRGWVLE